MARLRINQGLNLTLDATSTDFQVKSLTGPYANLLISGRNWGVEIRIDEDNSQGDTFRVTQGANGSNTLLTLTATGNLTTKGILQVGGFDLTLGTSDQASRGNTGASRALVKDQNSVLAINYVGDFSGGVRVDGPGMNVVGNLATGGNLTVGGSASVTGTITAGGVTVTGVYKNFVFPVSNAGSDGYVIDISGVNSGWARGLTVVKDGTRLAGVGLYGSSNSVHSFNVGFGSDWWAGGAKLTVKNDGKVGIGTTSPAYTLDVSGDVRWTGTLQGGTVPWGRLSGHPSVIAGTGLTGGGSLSGSVTLSIASGGVGTAQLADGAVTTPKLSDTGVTAGTYTKVTVDSKGRVTSGATLSATDLPSHTHDAANITSGRLSLARLPTSSVANRVLLVGSANTDPTYGQITPNHLGTGWVPYSRTVGDARMGLVILNPDVVTAWNVTASHSVIDDANTTWQVDPGAFGVDSVLSSSSIFRVPIPGFWNNAYDVYSVQVTTALYNGTSPLNPPSPSGTAGTVIVGNNSDTAYQVLGFEVVNDILWVWLKRARFNSYDGYNTRAFIQVLGRNNGNPTDSRLVVTHRHVLPNGAGHDKPAFSVPIDGGTVSLLYFIGFLHHIPSLHGTASRTVNISLVNAPSGVTLDTTSVTLSWFNQLFYNSLNLNIPVNVLAAGNYDFAVRFTYDTQTADIPVRLMIYNTA